MKLLITCIGLSLLCGCTTSGYPITFDSNPQGAVVICAGEDNGYTPVTLYYKREDVQGRTDIDASTCSANWASGAKKDYGRLPVGAYPDGIKQTLERPDVNGYTIDVQFALDVKKSKGKTNSPGYTPRNSFTNCYNIYGREHCTETAY